MKKELLNKEIEIVELYKVAWESHDVTLLSKIFSKDIIYEEKPNNILIGIKKLIEYWQLNSNKQKNVNFEPLRIKSFDDEIIVEWKAKFYHLLKRREIKLKGIIWMEIEDNKINHLTEYFHQY